MKAFLIFFRNLLDSRFWALAHKEIDQILRDRQLLVLLIVPPILQLLLYGFALNPNVQYLKLGVVDYAQVSASRELIAALTENRVFVIDSYPASEQQLAQQVEAGQLTVGLVIPPDFNRHLKDGKPADIQIFIDGVDANTAGIASGYIAQIVNRYNRQLAEVQTTPAVSAEVIFLYNPGLISSWFFVPGVMGLVLTIIGTMISAVAVVREKDTGTLEQLLMTPATAWEILMAKVVPIFFLLMGDMLFALTLGRLIFGLPFRGSFLLFIGLSGMYLFVSISLGIMLATISQSQQQVVLTSFFINLPIVQTSGAIAPIETMPPFFQLLSLLNPLRHYIAIVRGILLKGVGLEVLWVHALALVVFAAVLMSISVGKFRSQLS